MPKIVRPLTELQIKKAPIKEKSYKLFDGNGLSIIIYPSKKRGWFLEYSFLGKRKSMTLGYYPALSLSEARKITLQVKSDLKRGINPRDTFLKDVDNNKKPLCTFEEISEEYFKLQNNISQATIKQNKIIIKNKIIPFVKNQDINQITRKKIIEILKNIENQGFIETANRTFSLISRIFKYAVTIGKLEHNILADIDKRIILKKSQIKNFKHTTDVNKLQEILLGIENYFGSISVKRILQILPYVFVRPSNLRLMFWEEIDFEKKIWTIPATKMKMNKTHIVPLCDFVLNILLQQKEISSHSKYVFPSIHNDAKPLSRAAITSAWKRLDFDITSHGFRHTASTLLHENIHIHKIPSEVIEMQLAHKVGNSVHRVYNKALYIEDRVKLMQWWCSFLNNLKK
jgi:integrase